MTTEELKGLMKRYDLSISGLSRVSRISRPTLYAIFEGRPISDHVAGHVRTGIKYLLEGKAAEANAVGAKIIDDGWPLSAQQRKLLNQMQIATQPMADREFVEIGQQTAEPKRGGQPGVEIID